MIARAILCAVAAFVYAGAAGALAVEAARAEVDPLWVAIDGAGAVLCAVVAVAVVVGTWRWSRADREVWEAVDELGRTIGQLEQALADAGVLSEAPGSCDV